MKITREVIEHIADLAMLNLEEEEIERLTTEMGKILEYMDKLNEVDTSDVKPREHVIAKSNVFREDKVCKSLDRERYGKRSRHGRRMLQGPAGNGLRGNGVGAL